MTRVLVVAALLALADDAVATPALDLALTSAALVDARMRERGDCLAADLDVLRAATAALGAGHQHLRGEQSWIFPVERVTPATSIGGRSGNGYRPARRGACYAWKNPGHPAHDLFVADPDQNSRDHSGTPWQARAVDEGVVLVARDGWKPGDPRKGGNYVMLYLPARRQVAYYAHLETLGVRAGDSVARGAVLGVVGRTGLNAWPRRSPTHLHFALWDATTFVPVDPYALLRDAKQP